MICKNCGAKSEKRFCSNCGQSTAVGKLDSASFLSEVTEGVFQINRGLFYTLKELFLRPGAGITDYLDGKRKRHFKPFAYVFIFSTLYFLVTQATGKNTWLEDLIVGFNSGASEKESVHYLIQWFAKNFSYTTLALIPVFSFASYIVFKKQGRNYFEHLVINAFITGQQAIFYLSFALLLFITKLEVFESVPLFFAVFYTFWVFRQIFDKQKRVINYLSSFLTYLIYMLCASILLGVILLISGLK